MDIQVRQVPPTCARSTLIIFGSTPDAKKSIAKRFTSSEAPLTEDDVIVTSGCSGALDIAISSFVNDGSNVLIPAPGFSLYQTICNYHGAEPRCVDPREANRWDGKFFFR